jgi:hypothetical protein
MKLQSSMKISTLFVHPPQITANASDRLDFTESLGLYKRLCEQIFCLSEIGATQGGVDITNQPIKMFLAAPRQAFSWYARQEKQLARSLASHFLGS